MDDMQTFERRVAGEVDRGMGPSEPVDDAAIFTAITATQSGKRTTRPVFSAPRFVVACAIVALFGGLLLAGVLEQSSDVREPAAVPPTTFAPLPSEVIEPGVSRIAVDGGASAIAVGPDGSVWRVVQGLTAASSVAPLQGSPPPEAPFDARMIDVGPDGVVWVAGPSRVGSWDGREWTVWSAPVGQGPLAVLPAPEGAALVPWLSAEGSQVEGITNARIEIERLTRDGARSSGEPLAVDIPNDPDIAFASSPDGDVWVVVPSGARSASGDEGLIWRWDGEQWHAESMPGIDGEVRPRDVAVGTDGTVWVYLDDGRYYSGADTRHLARLQRDGWTVWTKDDGVPRNAYRPNPLLTVGHDGAVWMPTGACAPDPGLAVFDGVTSHSYLADWCIHDMVVAPDGSIWATGIEMDGADHGLFRIIPVEEDQADPGAEPSPDGSADTEG